MAIHFEPVQTRRTFEEAILQIVGKIRSGQLRAGDRMPSERRIASQMEISRPTLREAIRVLVNAGVVEVRPGASGGITVVSDYVPPDLLQTRSEMRMSEVAGVLEARRMIEPRVAQLAALRATESDFAAMETTIEEQQRVAATDFIRNEDRFLQLDVQFHLCMARATRNDTIAKLMTMLLSELEIARDMAVHLPLVPDWAIDVHRRTLAAIRAGNMELIEEVMDEHLGRMESVWEQETGQALIRPIPDFLASTAARSVDATSGPNTH
jgi:DNA-binding FadR family transcriptional regulator